MECIWFEKGCSTRLAGIHVHMQGTRGIYVEIPGKAQQSIDVEEAVTMFLERIALEIRKLATSYAIQVSDDEIFTAINQNMAMITAVYYESHGTVLNIIRKEGI